MFKKLFVSIFLSLITISSFLSAEIKYEYQEFGTLQTNRSHALSINNNGEVLGWYILNESDNARHHFLRSNDGSFFELPISYKGIIIDWQFLTEDGEVYGWGLNDHSGKTGTLLFLWAKDNEMVLLPELLGINYTQIKKINNKGQVLINDITEFENGKPIRFSAIWHNGELIKLKRLTGDLGIESEHSVADDMNDEGEVVGYSHIKLVYKNNVYKQVVHATLWRNNQVIDLHKKFPEKTQKYPLSTSQALAINNLGEIIMSSSEDGPRVLNKNLETISELSHDFRFNTKYGYVGNQVVDRKKNMITNSQILTNLISYKNISNSIWNKVLSIAGVNEKGEIIAIGETIYGETHAILFTPIKSK